MRCARRATERRKSSARDAGGIRGALRDRSRCWPPPWLRCALQAHPPLSPVSHLPLRGGSSRPPWPRSRTLPPPAYSPRPLPTTKPTSYPRGSPLSQRKTPPANSLCALAVFPVFESWTQISCSMYRSTTAALSPSTNQPPSEEMRAQRMLRPSSVRHCTTCGHQGRRRGGGTQLGVGIREELYGGARGVRRPSSVTVNYLRVALR